MEVPKANVSSQKLSSSTAAQIAGKSTSPDSRTNTPAAARPGGPLVSKERIVITARSPFEALAKAKQILTNRSGAIRQWGLGAIISKYAAETEKNLSLLFAEAQRTDSVLLFDEADALFGKRTTVRDGHDRFSNPPFSTLAEQIQAYRGTVIIASAQPATLDPVVLRKYAFVRHPRVP